jgi:hypothetical protein
MITLDIGSNRFLPLTWRTKRIRTVTRNNLLFLIVGALVIAVAVMGYQLYQDRHPPEGLNIKVGPGGLSIQGK